MLRHLLLLAAAMSLLGCPPQKDQRPDAQPTPTPGSGSGSTADGSAPEPSGGGSASRAEEECVNEWLKKQGLDEYGNPAGTMYAGGTPLFDEQTGKTTDRLEYIYRSHPEAKASCQAK